MFQTSTRTLLVLAFLLHNALAFGQDPDCPTPTFFKTWGNETKSEYGTVLTRSSDGNLYLAGRNGSKTFIQKTNLAGEPIWMREFQIGSFEPITPIQIFEDSEGMITGCGTQSQFAGATRGFVFRYDPVADSFLWAHPVASNSPAAAGILEKTPGGSFVYYQNPTQPSGETVIEILDLQRATGNIIPAFASRYKHIAFDALAKMVAVDGSLYGLGSASGRHDSTTAFDRRLLMARFDPVNGTPIWAQLSHLDTAAQADFYGRDLAVDGDTLIAAYVVDEDVNDPPLTAGPYNIHLQKTDLDGNILWVRKYDLSTSILRVMVVSDGYVLSGQRSFGSQYFVFKVNKNGDFLWGKNLAYGPSGNLNANLFGPQQSVAIADSLFFTGVATTGFSDVFLWKMLADGTMADSCGYVDSLSIQSFEIQNPVRTPIALQKLLSTASPTSVDVPWATNTLEEHLLCPDCTVIDTCPENRDFVVLNGGVGCLNGMVNLSLSTCDLEGGTIPDLNVTFYDANPFETEANKIETVFLEENQVPSNCISDLITNLVNEFGPAYIQDGFTIYMVTNDNGNAPTPFSPDDFPLSDIAECNYINNLDSVTIQLPTAPTLNLGPNQLFCPEDMVTLNAGPGFFKYQWSNGQSTQSVTVSFAGLYQVTATDVCGFKQVDTVVIQVRQQPQVTENGVFCPGKSVTIRGFTFDQEGVFQRNIPGTGTDCDTLATFFLNVLPYEEQIEVIYFCPFETVTINGVVYEDSQLVRDTLPSSVGCDTILFYFLEQLPLPFRLYNFEICKGDSVWFNGQYYTQAIGFTDTIMSVFFGCDTIAYVAIDYLPQVELSQTIQFCPGTSLELGGQTYTQPGTAIVNLPSSTGECDTVVTYTLEWLPAPTREESVQFCPGESVDIGGQTYIDPGIVQLTIPGTGGGCDTVVTYTLTFLPQPARSQTLQFCPGASVVIDGQTYSQPGTVVSNIPGTSGGCDTVVTYTLALLPLNTRSETLQFCPGASVVIDGQTYSQPGTVISNIAGTLGGCDTVVTYTLALLPLNTRAETLQFCEGESISLGGQTYTQPAIVALTAPGTNGACDTVVTYTLQYLTPPPSSIGITCPMPLTLTAVPGSGPVSASYNLPVATSDCVCPGIALGLTSGLASGSLFPVGTTQVCYAARDSCGAAANCCFTVTVREELPCDTKTNGCLQYDLLAITADAQQRYTYRIRVTNSCSSKLIYTAIQLPNGITAVSPANLSTYTSPDGRKYAVRNPNYSPFYSVRFKSVSANGISNGESEVFEYTLPAQSHPTFIHITSRLAPQIFYAAHLNTFNCPIGTTSSNNRSEEQDLMIPQNLGLSNLNLLLFPNPTNGELFADLSRWQGERLSVQILDSRGQRAQSLALYAGSEAQPIPLASQLPAGLYFLEIVTENGEREVARFVLER
ncbi:MAG: HYR domain-containing protein [Saprospiraceae bacterium]